MIMMALNSVPRKWPRRPGSLGHRDGRHACCDYLNPETRTGRGPARRGQLEALDGEYHESDSGGHHRGCVLTDWQPGS